MSKSMDETNDSENRRIENWLRIRGFDLFAVMDPARWPESLRESFRALDIILPAGYKFARVRGDNMTEAVSHNYLKDEIVSTPHGLH